MTGVSREESASRTPRRRFLTHLGVAAAASCLVPARAVLAARVDLPPRRELSFHSLHTDERLTATYLRGGAYEANGLAEIDFILRDWRSGEVWRMDRNLLDLLYLIRQKLDSHGPIQIVSGYRSPKTNAKLAVNSSGVAKRSLHMRGMAIDFRLPDRDLKAVHQTAKSLKAGGVGLYSKSSFIHLDTGRVRSWGG